MNGKNVSAEGISVGVLLCDLNVSLVEFIKENGVCRTVLASGEIRASHLHGVVAHRIERLHQRGLGDRPSILPSRLNA